MSMLQVSYRFVIAVVLVGLLLTMSGRIDTPLAAQAQGGDQCEQLATQVLASALQACTGIGPHEICAGSDAVSVKDADHTVRPLATGNRMLLEDLEAVATESADVVAGAWGVAVLSLPSANGIDSWPLHAVLFGRAHMARPVSVVGDRHVLAVYNPGGAAINYRNGAGITYDVIGQLAPGSQATADGRNAQGDWVRIQVDGTIAWVFTPLIGWEGDQAAIDALPVLLPNDVTPPVQPGEMFQAFVLTTEASPCSGAPSGLLLQSPADKTSSVVVNQVTLQAVGAATLLLIAKPGEPMLITVLDGRASVTARGVTQEASSGNVIQVALGGDDGHTPTAVPSVYSSTFTFADVAFAPLSLLPATIACHAGLPAANADVRLRVGPGQQRGEIGTMSPRVSYAVTGWANDPEGLPWWQLDTGQQPAWAPQAAVHTVGACEAVPQVEPPPVVLAPGIPEGAPAGGPGLAPTTNSVWQMKPGTDNLVGQCSGAPAINFCDHLAAIAPVAGGLSWKGMEPSPYVLIETQPGVYTYSGVNALGTGTLMMTLTFTSPTTLTMTMSLVLNSEPNCQHTYYYSGTRNW